MSVMWQYPSSPALQGGLQAILQPQPCHSVVILDRHPNPWGGTFPAEIVTCRVDGEGELRFFCKYETGASAGSNGHRGGVEYERQVYRDLLEPRQLTVPRFYGSYQDESDGWLCLVLGHLNGSVRSSKAAEPHAIVRAAEWIGDFQAMMQDHVRQGPPPFLFGYDLNYYQGWSERTLALSSSHDEQMTWLPAFCRRFNEAIGLLTREPLTVVHGEYYPHNVLWHLDTITPVDWESAAVGAGEIDLASLTERWPQHITQKCEQAYVRHRWPSGEPPDFARRLDLARLYLQLRWLGTPKGWRVPAEPAWRFGQIRHIAERQALL